MHDAARVQGRSAPFAFLEKPSQTPMGVLHHPLGDHKSHHVEHDHLKDLAVTGTTSLAYGSFE